MTHPYEPAAQIAENAALETTPEIRRVEGLYIAAKIRALPHPPERVLPVFTAKEVAFEMAKCNPNDPNGPFRSEIVADYVNARIAASGFAQSEPARGPVDLEKMQEAFQRAFGDFQDDQNEHPFFRVAAKYLAAEGFRLGDAPSSSGPPKNSTCHPDEAVETCPRLHAHSECMAHERFIQARIDAAVLAEREACLAKVSVGAAIQRNLATTSTNCRLEYKHAAIQLENLASTIRARTTNPEIAKPPRKDAAVGNPPPDTKGDKDPVELLLQRVTVLEYALLDVAKQARPLREWGGNVGQVMIAARKNGWDGTGK